MDGTIPSSYTTDDEKFPLKGLKYLASTGLTGLSVPTEYGGFGAGIEHNSTQLLEKLKEFGAYDLSLGRIFEGHINAMLLVSRFGSESQKSKYFIEAIDGKLFGIWNSELPSERLRFEQNGETYVFQGAKTFCSGAKHIERPIVTAEGPDGSYMVLLHLDEYDVEEDFTYWRPMGMKSSVSCRFDFSGKNFEEGQIVGKAYNYVAEPDFSGGAARFAAVQLGGAEAALRATFKHLKDMERTDATEQVSRLARLSILRETGNLWLSEMGKVMDRRYKSPSECVRYANMFRTVVREICEETLQLCELSVGLQGMIAAHPLERIHRDLSVYLKQPGPDRVLQQIGSTFKI
ncbi:MAG: acyl-CoA dehydrogenase family protein [Pricia sp.]